MEIAIGSKWIHTRTNNQYEVIQVLDCAIHEGNLHYDGLEIWYKDQQGEIYARTEKHFLDSFKPYEPVYEFKMAYDIGAGLRISSYMTELEFIRWQGYQPEKLKYQRLDFTKRERK